MLAAMKHDNNHTDRRILIYQKRTASECMNAAIDFIRANWRPLLRFSLYFLLPISVIQSVGVVSIVDSITSDFGEFSFSHLLSVLVFGLIGFVLLNSVIWTIMKQYHEQINVCALTFRTFIRPYIRMFGRMSIVTIPIIIMMILSFALASLILVFMPFAFFVYMLMALPVLMIAPIYAMEETSIFKAVGRAFSLGYKKLGHLILISITLAIMTYVVQAVMMLPCGLCFAFKDLLFGNVGSNARLLGNTLFNVSSVLMCYGTYVSISIPLISVGYLYGSVAQESEDVSLMTDIENFENL